MRLKLYKEYKEEKLYKKIDWDTFYPQLRKILPFTEEEFEEMKKYFPKLSPYIDTGYTFRKIDWLDRARGVYQDEYYYTTPLGDKFYTRMVINKIPDEWYMCEIGHREYYKCDTFEGLIQLLKDKKHQN